ncbi:hypothetical protein ABZW30_42045 [Kitasatospora sp. NPDC004669]|uniref:hypothetical protein n=1 Tax=Kitasatospora sp. NPDC004669 TaxID=3154555 RepID=UPI0033A653F4
MTISANTSASRAVRPSGSSIAPGAEGAGTDATDCRSITRLFDGSGAWIPAPA